MGPHNPISAEARTHPYAHTLIFIHALGLICIECNIHSIDLLTQMHSHSQTRTRKYNLPLRSHTDSHTHNCPPLLTCFFTPCSFGDVNASRHVQCALTAEGGEGVCVRVCVCSSMCVCQCACVCVYLPLLKTN